MAETLESIKQEIAKIAAEKADLKGIVDQQKETIKRQETTIGNLQEALKAADANMVDRVNKLQKEIDHYKKYADEEHTHKVRAWDSNGLLNKENEQLQNSIDELKAELTDWKRIAEERKEKSIQIHNARVREEKQVIDLQKEIDELKAELEASKAAHNKTWEEKENFREKNLELKNEVALLESIDAEDHHEDVIELQQKVSKLEAIRDAYAKEIDVLRADNEELEANGNAGTIAALAAKDEELRKLGEKVPAKDREINDLKEQVKSLEEALDLKGDYYYRAQTEKEHLANAIENAYRSLMIIRGYQLPGESGVSNG